MIRTLLAVLIVFSSLSLSAQGLSKKNDKAINKRMATYSKLTKEENYSALMDLIYPKIFEGASREQMIEVFNGLEAQGFNMIVEEMKIADLKPITMGNSANYVLCPYNMKMKILLESTEMQNPAMADRLLEAFKTIYSTGTVTFDKEKYIFSIEGEKYIIAIQDREYGKKWYFAEFDQSNPAGLSMMFPEEVIKKTKELIKD